MMDFKGSQFERGIILWGVRWYVAYPISYRQLEEMMQERGVEVDHSSLNRWVLKYTPVLDQAFRQRKRPVGASWRMDETYISVKGQMEVFGIEPSTKRDTLLTSFSLPSGTAKQLPATSAKPSTSAVRRRRSPSTRLAPTRRRSKATMQHMKPASKSATSSISTISSSRTTERSNE